MEHASLGSAERKAIVFARDQGRTWIRELFGIPCGDCGDEPRSIGASGMAVVSTSLGRLEGVDLAVAEEEFDAHTARIVWTAPRAALHLESGWSLDPHGNVLSRRDRLTNSGDAAVTVLGCLARFTLPPADYEVYAQDSRWSRENQGHWIPLRTGAVVLSCEPGRTTQGGTPYACVREAGADLALAFHILPVGNWIIRIATHAVMNAPGCAVIDLGLSDADLRARLEPGESLPLPEILIQPLPDGTPRSAAPSLHRFALDRDFAGAKPQPPLVYNTWFDQFEILDVDRLRGQLAAAKEIGCEIFVVDAGWYGAGEGPWYAQAGDWREKHNAAFRGRMVDFAEEVRAAGLGYGLWMEPERFAAGAPARKAHPEWFVETSDGMARIDLEQPAARDYLKGEISRLVDTYKLAWMKVDFNFHLGRDATGRELSGYYQAWYRLLDELRAAHPETFFEGCASGGLRSDLTTLRHFDVHFLSDTVNPVDILRITQGALLRLPPGRLGKWAVLRSAGDNVAQYGKSAADSPASVITPCGAGWTAAEMVDVDFACLAAMSGIFGFSGDPASLTPATRARLAEHAVFYKQWRGHVVNSVAHLLTAPRPIEDRTGWVAFQLGHQADSLVFVYRLAGTRSRRRFPLKDLDPRKAYTTAAFPDTGRSAEPQSGAHLMTHGLEADLPADNTARAYVVRPADALPG